MAAKHAAVTLDRAGPEAWPFFDPGSGVHAEQVLEELARPSLIPVVAGLSPMDSADLVHTEAQHIAKRLAARAVADGRNLLLDVTMGSQPSVQSWLVNLGLAAYAVRVIIAPISGQDAARWAGAEHRRGHEEYKNGHGNGGRYIPADAILLAAQIAGAIADSDWATILQHVGSQTEVAFPAGELLGLARDYQHGTITLQDLGRQLRTGSQTAVPAVCPPGLEQARPAADDLEPWAAGSFDETVLACDLGIFSDEDYEALVVAISS